MVPPAPDLRTRIGEGTPSSRWCRITGLLGSVSGVPAVCGTRERRLHIHARPTTAPLTRTRSAPDAAAFVGYAPDVIGRCAADYVGEHARRSRISSPSVLVIGSSRLHTGRQAEFVKRLKLRLQDTEFMIDENGDFDRARARKIVCQNLRVEEDVVPNYIFCTNDEMALGAVDALGLMDLGTDGSVVVVGVDGIPEARALIDSQRTPLRATVVQDSCRMAEIATDLLYKAIGGKHIEKYNYLDPHIYSKHR